MAKDKVFYVRVDDETHRELSDVAAKQERSVSYIINKVVKAYLKELKAGQPAEQEQAHGVSNVG